MTTSKFDMAYGRQGGRIVDYEDEFDADDFPRCQACGEPMVVGQRDRHYLCRPRSFVGRRCVCAPGCTDTHVGDRGRCLPDCHVCTVLMGRPYDEIEEFRKNRKPVVQADDEATEQANQLTIFGGVA